MSEWHDDGARRRRRRPGWATSVRTLVVLGFAVIQAILVGRILVDVGVLDADGSLAQLIVPWSDALAAPVQEIGRAFGRLLGSGGVPGGGFGLRGVDPTIVAALAGWTVVEWLVMRVVGRVASA